MTTITYSGEIPDIFFVGFMDVTGVVDVNVLLETSTQIIVQNNTTGAVITFYGTDLAFTDGDAPTTGTVTSMAFEMEDTTFATITDINWGFSRFDDALEGLETNSPITYDVLAELINGAGPLTVDARSYNGTFDFAAEFEPLAELVTVDITYLDTPGDDVVLLGMGDDTIEVASAGDYSEIEITVTPGDNTLDFSDVSDPTWVQLSYSQYPFTDTPSSVSVTLDGVADSYSATGDGFSDTIIGMGNVLSEGIGISGSTAGDSFDVTLGDQQYVHVAGGEGVDNYVIDIIGDAKLRLDFLRGIDSNPTQGLVIDLGAGTVSNDGFGNAETIVIEGNAGMIEVRGTNNADSMTGSDGDDSFITRQGNDTVDGGLGFDQVRYDRTNVGAITVDLAAGTASGTWNGVAFTDTLISIERVEGTDFNDTMSGTDADEAFASGAGDDYLQGFGGDDTLDSDQGQDTIDGGEGFDTADIEIDWADAVLSSDGSTRWVIDESGNVETMISIEQIWFNDSYAIAGTNGFGDDWTVYNEAGTRLARISMDSESRYSWAMRTETYTATGARDGIITVSDNGNVQTVVIDPDTGLYLSQSTEDVADIYSWASMSDSYTAGVLTTRTTVDDDGDINVTTFDLDGNRTGFTLTDSTDSFSYATLTHGYDAAGNLLTREMVLDDGDGRSWAYTDSGVLISSAISDGSDTRSWAIYTNNYDEASGLLTDRVVVEDDGDTQTTTFDAAGNVTEIRFADLGTDDEVWDELIFTYDASGDLLSQKLVYDDSGDTLLTQYGADGLRDTVVYTDVDGNVPWETRTDVYLDDGVTIDTRTFGYADGSETVVDYFPE